MIKGVIAGRFDILHHGHIFMFKEAKKKCDHLTVLVHSFDDQVMHVQYRVDILGAIRYIDYVTYYHTEEELEQILERMHFNVRFIGSDYEGKEFTGKHIVDHEYIQKIYSSTMIKNKLMLRGSGK